MYEQRRLDRQTVGAAAAAAPTAEGTTWPPAQGSSPDRQWPLWPDRTGAPWRDLPDEYGPWQTIATRFYRWRRAGVWDRVLAELRAQADVEGKLDCTLNHVDSTMIRAHQHAAVAQKRRTTT